MKILFVFFALVSSVAFSQDTSLIKKDIEISLNSWHKAATNADFEVYFGLMTDDAIFSDTSSTIRSAIQHAYDSNSSKKNISKTAFEIALKELL